MCGRKSYREEGKRMEEVEMKRKWMGQEGRDRGEDVDS